ncbi:isocitrate lyase/PEP mutase family protein [Candidatus Binatus sp.]|jgi:2-methylisocitrate lyase-like PEP mutase family enzyme|uniref:isocitrate lyase/PEP mutase family protein n=1 Tax=Candidatus Binatus sp. TaxID=2811406 RepID=UPI003C58304D
MNRDTQRAKAEAFRAMHDRSRILVLPNAWDAMSARVIEEAGARAIATTSAGVAFSVGYPDGEAMPRDEMIAAIARIARVVTVPVSADIESGFAHDARELAETVRRVIDAGAVGINLEDRIHDGAPSLYDLEVGVRRVRAAREAADSSGVPIVINARTDVYLLAIGEADTRFEHAVRRANAYRKAGADCLFIPAVTRRADVERIVPALEGPLNLLVAPGIPPVPELERLGVARLSVGTRLTLGAMSTLRNTVAELLSTGTCESTLEGATTYAEANHLMASRRS